MSDRQIFHAEPAYVLHTRAYRESSLLVELFTRHHGRIALVANSVRGKKNTSRGALLQPFYPINISYSMRSDLGRLHDVESNGARYVLSAERLISAFYLNELMMRLTLRGDESIELYDGYAETLDRLATGDLENTLRYFEKHLLEVLGYGMNLEHDVKHDVPVVDDQEYIYDPDHGPALMVAAEIGIRVSGRALLAFAAGKMLGDEDRKEIKKLMRAVLNRYLDHRPLHTRNLFELMSVPGSRAS